MASIHDKLQRVRKPRVHIRFDVETEGAVPVNELPFVVGVLGDFSGSHPTKGLRPLRERRFVEINRDNFDEIMSKMTPGLQLRVANTLAGDDSEFPVSLKFNKMEDFEPAAIVQQVEPLRRLQEKRDRLRDLMTKADRSVDLEALLEDMVQDQSQLSQLLEELGQVSDDSKGK